MFCCVVSNAKRTKAQITYEGLKTARRMEYFLLDCCCAGPVTPDSEGNQYIWTGYEPYTTIMECGRAVAVQDSATAMDFLLLEDVNVCQRQLWDARDGCVPDFDWAERDQDVLFGNGYFPVGFCTLVGMDAGFVGTATRGSQQVASLAESC